MSLPRIDGRRGETASGKPQRRIVVQSCGTCPWSLRAGISGRLHCDAQPSNRADIVITDPAALPPASCPLRVFTVVVSAL